MDYESEVSLAARGHALDLFPVVLVPLPSSDVQDMCLAGDVLVTGTADGLWLYKQKEGSEVIWQLYQQRLEDCFLFAYLCVALDPFFASRGPPFSSRYFRYVCIAAGNEECGHSVCVCSCASTFVNHHELHGTHRILCCAMAPVNAVGSSLFHQSPFVVSVDAAGHVAVFDVDRSGAQLVVEEGNAAQRLYQLPEGLTALQTTIHGPCEDRECCWCWRRDQSVARGTPITMHVLVRHRGGSSLFTLRTEKYDILQLQILWTTHRAVLHSVTNLLSISPLATDPGKHPELSLTALPQTEKYVLQISAEGIAPGGLRALHGCTGVPLISQDSGLEQGLLRWLPLGELCTGRYNEEVPSLWDCSVGLTSEGNVLLLGSKLGLSNSPRSPGVTASKMELDQWLNSDEEEGASKGCKMTEPASRTAPTYTILSQLFSVHSFEMLYRGMYTSLDKCIGAAGVHHGYPEMLYFDAARRSVVLRLQGQELFSLGLPVSASTDNVTDEVVSQRPSGGGVAPASSSTMLTKRAFSWGLARSLAGTLLNLSSNTNHNKTNLHLHHTAESGTPAAGTTTTTSCGNDSLKPKSLSNSAAGPEDERLPGLWDPLSSPPVYAASPVRLVDALTAATTVKADKSCRVNAATGDMLSAPEAYVRSAVHELEDEVRWKTASAVNQLSHCISCWELTAVREPLQREQLKWEVQEQRDVTVVRALLFSPAIRGWEPHEEEDIEPFSAAAETPEELIRRGTSSTQFFAAYYSQLLEASPAWGSDEQQQQLMNYLAEYELKGDTQEDSAPQVMSPGFILDMQEQDRLTYELEDLILRHNAELEGLDPYEEVLLTEVQERTPSGSWTGLSKGSFFNTAGSTADLARWNKNADGSKKGQWEWVPEDRRLARGERKTIIRDLRGWTLGPWMYASTSWAPEMLRSENEWGPTEDPESLFRRRRIQRRRFRVAGLKKLELRRQQHQHEVAVLRESLFGP